MVDSQDVGSLSSISRQTAKKESGRISSLAAQVLTRHQAHADVSSNGVETSKAYSNKSAIKDHSRVSSLSLEAQASTGNQTHLIGQNSNSRHVIGTLGSMFHNHDKLNKEEKVKKEKDEEEDKERDTVVHDSPSNTDDDPFRCPSYNLPPHFELPLPSDYFQLPPEFIPRGGSRVVTKARHAPLHYATTHAVLPTTTRAKTKETECVEHDQQHEQFTYDNDGGFFFNFIAELFVGDKF